MATVAKEVLIEIDFLATLGVNTKSIKQSVVDDIRALVVKEAAEKYGDQSIDQEKIKCDFAEHLALHNHILQSIAS